MKVGDRVYWFRESENDPVGSGVIVRSGDTGGGFWVRTDDGYVVYRGRDGLRL